jgi:hypothetical protein
MTTKISFVIVALMLPNVTNAQEDLMNLLDQDSTSRKIYTEATFKGTRLINGHSVETRKEGVLDVLISHRFGRINSGAYEFFGLDESNVRLGLDYGITDRFTVGIGRNSFEKTFDGFLKYKVVRQRSAQNGMPFSVTAFSSAAIKTLKPANDEETDFGSKLSYAYQILVARKFSDSFSFQLMPSLVHNNRVIEGHGYNDVYALGAGGRLKITKSVSLNVEYYYRFNPAPDNTTHNAVAIGFDIESGGHVFQLHFTNSRAMIEKGFINETTGDFFEGDIHFGFNISRVFQLH